MSAMSTPIHIVAASTGAASVFGRTSENPEMASTLGPANGTSTGVPGLRDENYRLLDMREGKIVCGRSWRRRSWRRPRRRMMSRWSRDERAGGGCASSNGLLCLRPKAAALPIKPRGIDSITGGLGGIGLQLARMARGRHIARRSLTARRPLPPRAEWDQYLLAHEIHGPEFCR